MELISTFSVFAFGFSCCEKAALHKAITSFWLGSASSGARRGDANGTRQPRGLLQGVAALV
jgi:hypothetical protein